ncbi:MAG TPA: ThuA domain-containing protein [Tepidisphaeraceae bacterium]|nr:ThuA domain-containing protein [Tepidisphaeraceae bacterium]
MEHQFSRRQALGMGAAAGLGLLLSSRVRAADSSRRVIVWSEGTAPKRVYPEDIRGAVADGLKPLQGWEITTATITDPGQGVPEETLNKTDVLMWWGHQKHGQVKTETVQRIVKRVKEGGMGFIALHSSHFAKPYKALMGTMCSWSHYVDDGAKCDIIVKEPNHPIAKGISNFSFPHTERYGEPFKCPPPEAVPFDGLYTLKDGKTEQSRQGLCWTVGKGRVFYFQPGHEAYPIFFQDEIRHILRNAVEWAAPQQTLG